MFKSYSLFLEAERSSRIRDIKSEILSNPGWVEDEKNHEHWDWSLSYLMEGVKINVISLKRFVNGIPTDSSICYYINMGGDNNFTNNYTNNYTILYSDSDNIYRNMSDYERMMKICKYLLSYFKKKPSDKTTSFIKNCFLDISDICGEFEEIWGYSNNKDTQLYFPAFSFRDVLSFGLFTDYYANDSKWDEIKSEFELSKEKLLIEFDINPRQLNQYVKIENDPVRIIIDNRAIIL
jgi:hypothetical protein